ncbi:hypothetical protein M569_16363 [Genlisea aurea]|uniref:Uncharacterized protein n=1 Tax=Genlisea aurea TaxID=192259 RepID=S8C208_9LAMI|nr:hypothetical protein M569_16363 [Genlisea aurea]
MDGSKPTYTLEWTPNGLNPTISRPPTAFLASAATRRFRHSAVRAAEVQIQCRLRPDGANPAPTGSGGAFPLSREHWLGAVREEGV